MHEVELLVPFADKDRVKALGAKWDIDRRVWVAPLNRHFHLFKRWSNVHLESTLYIDIVPESGWYKNLRSELTENEWKLIRTFVYARAGNKCEICGGCGDEHPVEAHERWHYDDINNIQQLVGIQALCPKCHMVSHFGLANKMGRSDEAKAHMLCVNGWDEDRFKQHYYSSFNKWEERSKQKWTLDATWIIEVFPDFLTNESIRKIMDLAPKE